MGDKVFNVHVCLQGGFIPSVLSGTPLYMTIIAVFLLTKISSALGQAIDPFAIIERFTIFALFQIIVSFQLHLKPDPC